MKKIQKLSDSELDNVTGGGAIDIILPDGGWEKLGNFHGNGCTGRIKSEGALWWSTLRCTNCHEEHDNLNQYRHYSIKRHYICKPVQYFIEYDDGSVVQTAVRPPELDYPWNHA